MHECYDNASKKCLAKRYFCCGQGPDRNGRQLIARKLTGGKAETPLAHPPDGRHRGRIVMVGFDLRHREKNFKDGRHVGLDFYDLLIEATKFNQQPPWVAPSPTGDLRR